MDGGPEDENCYRSLSVRARAPDPLAIGALTAAHSLHTAGEKRQAPPAGVAGQPPMPKAARSDAATVIAQGNGEGHSAPQRPEGQGRGAPQRPEGQSAVPPTASMASVASGHQEDEQAGEPQEPPGPPRTLYSVLDDREECTGWNLFHILAALGAAQELAMLIALFRPTGCPIGAPGWRFGETPLEVALQRGHAAAARVILRASELGNLPWDVACAKVAKAAVAPGPPPAATANGSDGKLKPSAKEAEMKASLEKLRRLCTSGAA